MKYKLVSGLKLQYGHTQTSNRVCRNLLRGQAVELKKENLEELKSLGVKVQPIEKIKKPKNEEK